MCRQRQAGAGREQLSLPRAGEAFRQRRSRPCLTMVPSSPPRQPARLPDTQRVRYHAWLRTFSATPWCHVLSAGVLAAGQAGGPGERGPGCPLPLPHCPGVGRDAQGATLCCAEALSGRFARRGGGEALA